MDPPHCTCFSVMISNYPQTRRRNVRKHTSWHVRPKKNSNQPAHPRSQISAFVVRMKKLCVLGYPKCAQWKFWSDWANAQTILRLTCRKVRFLTLRLVVSCCLNLISCDRPQDNIPENKTKTKKENNNENSNSHSSHAWKCTRYINENALREHKIWPLRY